MKRNFIWRLAINNTKLTKEIYKRMMERSNLIVGKIPLKTFKEAFHSERTKPEYRSMLLSSLYYAKPDYNDFLHKHMNIPKDVYRIRLIPESDVKGIRLSLVGNRESNLKPRKILMPKWIKADIRGWNPKANKQELLTKAIMSTNIQYQKVALGIESILSCLYEISFISQQFVLLNDPQGIYNSSPIQTEIDNNMRAFFAGHYNHGAKLFKQDLTNIMVEFDKYVPFMDKLGVDVADIRGRLTYLYNTFIQYETAIQSDVTDNELHMLYRTHRIVKPFIESILEGVRTLQNIDEFHPAIYELSKGSVIPQYINYKNTSTVINRTIEVLDTDLDRTLEEIISSVTPINSSW